LGLVALLLLPLVGAQWRADYTIARDTVYFPAGATLAAATPPGAGGATLVFDPGYTFVAGRPPAAVPGVGRLVDSAGAMVYYGEDMDRASWSDLVGRVLQFSREENAQAIFYSIPAQASALSALPNAAAVVVDGKIGEPDLRPQSQDLIRLLTGPTTMVEYARVAAVVAQPGAGVAPLGVTAPPLELWVSTLAWLRADGSSSAAQLLGNSPASAPPADATAAQLGLYWRVPPGGAGADYRVALRLRDPAGQIVAQTDSRPGEDGERTSTWRPGWIYPDLHNLPLPPPGSYQLELTLYAPNDGATTWELGSIER
jgi:hypothetical protein